MTTEPDTRPAVRLCCGKPGAWLPGKGKPQRRVHPVPGLGTGPVLA